MAISLGPPLPLTLPYMPSTSMVDHNKHTTTAAAAATKRADLSCPWPGGPIQLTSRFALLKENLISGNEAAITASFHRLLSALPEEIDRLSNLGSAAIPSISFAEAQSNPQLSQQFLTTLRERGVGVLRGVVPRETALQWAREAREYAAHLGPSFSSSSGRSRSSSGQNNNNNNNNIFWSPAQVKARAHPDVLAAQKFVMTGAWRSADPRARVTAEFPITYADRMGTRTDNLTAGAPTVGTEASRCAQVDGGSVERWEKDGYGGRKGVYRDIWAGRWEEFDPWESSARLGVTSDLYHKASACSIFRMFQGWLALGDMPSGQPGSVRVCPLPRHATAYFLLRPFFSPSSGIDNDSGPDEKWTLDRPQNSILHGALPSYAQTISPSFHPHLDLPRSLIPVPDLHPGDYLVWHPDLIHSVVSSLDDLSPSIVTTTTTYSSSPSCSSTYTHIYLPACPLTQTNALYLARQRKSFLSGTPGPDFGGHRFSSISSSTSSTPSSRRGSAFSTTTTSSSLYTPPTHLFSSLSSSSHLSAYFGGPSPGLSGGGGGGGGETSHAHRAGPTEVGDAGGDDGLRAMGLVPWDEEEADEDATREVLAMANGILFPDLYDYDLL